MFDKEKMIEAGREEIDKLVPLIAQGPEVGMKLAACLLGAMYAMHLTKRGQDYKLVDAALEAIQYKLASMGITIDLTKVDQGFQAWLKTPEGKQALAESTEEVAKRLLKEGGHGWLDS